MVTKITDKFQITIPKEIRTKFKLTRHDSIDWKMENGKILIEPIKRPIANYKGSIHIEPGNIQEDIEKVRRIIADESS
jgi:AbrB family looped-hinge helix DNA binding protein